MSLAFCIPWTIQGWGGICQSCCHWLGARGMLTDGGAGSSRDQGNLVRFHWFSPRPPSTSTASSPPHALICCHLVKLVFLILAGYAYVDDAALLRSGERETEDMCGISRFRNASQIWTPGFLASWLAAGGLFLLQLTTDDGQLVSLYPSR